MNIYNYWIRQSSAVRGDEQKGLLKEVNKDV